MTLSDNDFNYVEAEAEFRRALEVAPQDASVTSSYAGLLVRLGRLDESLALRERAIALEPLNGALYQGLSGILTALGRYDEAEAAVRKAIELRPQAAQNYTQLAIIQILRGKAAAAVELAKQETDPFLRTCALALARFANGDQAEADVALKKLIAENADYAGSQIAQVYALRKEPEKMFEWLEHAWATHDAGVALLLSDPFLRAYKDDPLHRLRPKGRGHAETRRQAVSDDSLRLKIGYILFIDIFGGNRGKVFLCFILGV